MAIAICVSVFIQPLAKYTLVYPVSDEKSSRWDFS